MNQVPKPDSGCSQLSKEREHLETVIGHRFNFLIVFVGVILAAATQCQGRWRVALLGFVGFVVCALLALTLHRAQLKFDILFKKMEDECEGHPMVTSTKDANALSKSARNFISRVLPVFFVFVFFGLTVIALATDICAAPAGPAQPPTPVALGVVPPEVREPHLQVKYDQSGFVQRLMEMPLGDWSGWAAAVATVAAVAVALFRGPFLRWWMRPWLFVSMQEIGTAIDAPVIVPQPQNHFDRFESRRYRLAVRNGGRSAAKDVECFLYQVVDVGQPAEPKIAPFIPGVLRRTESNEKRPDSTIKVVPALSHRFVELFAVVPTQCAIVTGEVSPIASGEHRLMLGKVTKANSADHCLEPGSYELHIEVTAANAKTAKVVVAIAPTGEVDGLTGLPLFRAVVRKVK